MLLNMKDNGTIKATKQVINKFHRSDTSTQENIIEDLQHVVKAIKVLVEVQQTLVQGQQQLIQGQKELNIKINKLIELQEKTFSYHNNKHALKKVRLTKLEDIFLKIFIF